MKNKINKLVVENNEKSSEKLIFKYLKESKIIQIKSSLSIDTHSFSQINHDGPGIILKSSGSQHKPKFCFHEVKNLNQSANFSGIWLKEQGFNLRNIFIFNTLPLNHISGFMPLWRSKIWECEYINISPNLIKRTKDLLEYSLSIKKNTQKRFITSLVPTQLYRLLTNKDGISWLKLFHLIWVGGASISRNILETCIKEKINISPCYGATETAAMVSSLKPQEFLNRNFNAGELLKDVNIKINSKNLIEIKTDRIGLELGKSSEIIDFKNENGWWESGDIGTKFNKNNKEYLKVYGRIDNTIISGGETIFLDLIEKRIEDFIIKRTIPIEYFKFEKINDKMWGSRYEILIYFKKNIEENIILKSLEELNSLSDNFSRFERPVKWLVIKSNLNDKNVRNWKKIL